MDIKIAFAFACNAPRITCLPSSILRTCITIVFTSGACLLDPSPKPSNVRSAVAVVRPVRRLASYPNPTLCSLRPPPSHVKYGAIRCNRMNRERAAQAYAECGLRSGITIIELRYFVTSRLTNLPSQGKQWDPCSLFYAICARHATRKRGMGAALALG